MSMGSGVMTMSAVSMTLALLFTMMKEEKENKGEEKASFECGFDNMSSAKMNFSTNFVSIIMMFLVFDIEIAIMIPMIMSEIEMKMDTLQPIFFLAMLSALLLKEWAQGAIDWNK